MILWRMSHVFSLPSNFSKTNSGIDRVWGFGDRFWAWSQSTGQVGCPKTLESSACLFLTIESQNWEVKMQVYYVGVVRDVGNEQN